MGLESHALDRYTFHRT